MYDVQENGIDTPGRQALTKACLVKGMNWSIVKMSEATFSPGGKPTIRVVVLMGEETYESDGVDFDDAMVKIADRIKIG